MGLRCSDYTGQGSKSAWKNLAGHRINDMKKFNHINAKTIDEAVTILRNGRAQIFAGGTDCLGILKDDVLPDYPEALINIKTIPDMDYIKEENGVLRIGALAKIADIARDITVNKKYTALADAAGRISSPQLREMGTIGGNICQLTRCWYFRVADNRFFCLRKGGHTCPAINGEDRYHSIFGAVNGCVAVNVSDMAPVLIVSDAKIQTTKRVIDVEQFFSVKGHKSTVLDDDEMVTEVQIQEPAANTRSAFVKFALRKSFDFPIVNCAATINGSKAKICLNAVFNTPYRVTLAEESIAGKEINEVNAEAASEAGLSEAKPLTTNKYKVQVAKVMVKRAILACK